MTNYIQDIIRSGMGEKATLIKTEEDVNEWGDPENIEEKTYEFLTVVDSMDRAENEQEAGDFIEGDIRFFVSEECDIEFQHGDIIEYDNRRFDIDTVNTKTLGSRAFHKEIIAESV